MVGTRLRPVLVEIAKDMQQVAKKHAIMLQYANPMAANCLALGRIYDSTRHAAAQRSAAAGFFAPFLATSPSPPVLVALSTWPPADGTN